MPKRLVRSGPARCHSTQLNGGKIAKSIAAHFVLYGTCPWHVERILTLSLLMLERLNRFGPKKLSSAFMDDSTVFYGTWHMFSRIYSLQPKADPILTRPTTFDTGKCWDVVVSMPALRHTRDSPEFSETMEASV